MSESADQAIKNRHDALAIVAMAAASLFMAVGGYVITEHGKRLDKKDDRLSRLEVSIATISEHVDSHDAEKTYWIEVIKECQKSREALIERISRIETKPTARPDPFTGTQGKRLEEMINELRRQLYTPKHETNEEQ